MSAGRARKRARKPASRLRRKIAPPSLEGVGSVGDGLDAWAREVDLPDERRRELLLAYDELASNVANHSRRASEIRIEARQRVSGAAVLVVEDDGSPFDPLRRARPRTDQPLAERPIGGLGILFVRELAAEVAYERRGRRNRVVVRLHP